MGNFFKKALSLAVFLLLLTNCTNKDDTAENVDAKKVEYAFYNPKVNTVNNEDRKIVFNSDLLKTEEMNFIKNGIVKELLEKDFNQLAGVTVYYNNAVLNQNVKFHKNNILGIIVYELDKDGLMRNRFFMKNNQNIYEEKVSLLESMMSTTNQVFLVYKFLPEIYKISTIGISTLRDVNLDTQKLLKQRNEFNLFRVVNTFQNIRLNDMVLRTDEDDEFFRGIVCVNCAESGMGECDGGFYCNVTDPGAGQDETISDNDGDEEGICPNKERRYAAYNSGLISQSVAENLFDLELHRRLRDNLMINYNIGEKYIEYYYAIGGFLSAEDYPADTLIKMISTLPDLNSSIEKLVDQTNNGTEIIITDSLRNDMFAIIADLQSISDNLDYQYILNDLKNDLNSIKNKTKDELLNELD